MVPGKGPLPSFGLVIGEAPGRVETVRGEPFVGPSGAMLDQAFAVLGISRDELYITNLVKEWPQDEVGATRRPTLEEINHWRPLLDRELEACSPAAILLLGKTAAESWGYVPQMAEDNIFAAWHPAYLLHRNRELGLWEQWLFQLSPFVHTVREAEALRT
jgi:uracil-DNA glycosylase family 4